MTISQIIGWTLAVLGILGIIGTWYGVNVGGNEWWVSLLVILGIYAIVGIFCGFVFLIFWLMKVIYEKR